MCLRNTLLKVPFDTYGLRYWGSSHEMMSVTIFNYTNLSASGIWRPIGRGQLKATNRRQYLIFHPSSPLLSLGRWCGEDELSIPNQITWEVVPTFNLSRTWKNASLSTLSSPVEQYSGGKVRLCCGPDVVGVSVMVVSGSFTSSNTPNRIRQ